MFKISNFLIKNKNNISKYLLISVVFIYSLYTFQINQYELLFIDERLIIDDIYNIWLIDDYVNRYSNINHQLLKNIAVVLTELSYGGDLRYGRLWSNLFIFTAGPFIALGDSLVITLSRLVNIFLFLLAGNIFGNAFFKNDYKWLFLITFYSLPGVDMYQRFPKADVLALVFTSLAFNTLLKKNYKKTIFFMSIAMFIKINFIILFVSMFVFIFYKKKEKLKFLVNSFFITLFSLLFVNPVLIIPPINLFGINLPNFYKIYINWLITQGSFGQNELFNWNRISKWSEALGKNFNIPKDLSAIFFLLLFFFVIFLLKISISNSDNISIFLILTFLIYLFYYSFFIDRTFIWYLNLPFVLLTIVIYRNIKYINYNPIKVIIFIFVFSGILFNLSSHINDKIFVASSSLGYEVALSPNTVIKQLNETVDILEMLVSENRKQSTVYWHPDLFMPRNGVTFNGNIYIRELWGTGEVENLLNENYVYVTHKNLNIEDIKKLEIFNYNIYYK